MRSSLFIILCLVMHNTYAQTKWWGGYTVNEVVDKADLIFEGRILTDSPFFQNSPGHIFSAHRVLVLKQFKGEFKSDIVMVVTNGGKMILDGVWQGGPDYAKAVFLVTNSTKVAYGGNDPNAFDPFYGPGVSYISICDKIVVVKEVYEPLEKAIGHPYVELRPNTCAEQKAKADAKEKAEHPHRKFNINEK